MKKNKKLVLFDIDGTLINTKGSSIPLWKESIEKAFSEVFKPLPAFDERKLNGKLERKYFRELADLVQINQEDFEKKFLDAVTVFTKNFITHIDSGAFAIFRIDDAFELVTRIQKQNHITLGLLTGNNEPLAWHKLKKVDFHSPFSFGAFGTEEEDRGELVVQTIKKAHMHFSHPFTTGDTIIVGDTKYDIAAGKYAGAITLGVTTGHTDTREDLEKAGADMVVDSLMDPRVLSFLDLV